MKTHDYTYRPAEYVSAYRSSGLSRRAFGRVNGVPESTLREWEKSHVKSARLTPKAKTTATKKAGSSDYEVVMNELSTVLASVKRIQKILTAI